MVLIRQLVGLILLVSVLGLGIVTAQESSFELIDLDAVEADLKGLIDDNQSYFEKDFTVRRTGSTIRLDLIPLSGDLDTLLYLVDTRTGNIIAENDDRPTLTPEIEAESRNHPRISVSSYIEFPQAAAGQYRVIATRYGTARGRTSGQFRLLIDVVEDEPPLSSISYRTTPGALLDAGFPEMEPKPRAEWTVLAYYGGDTNLEPGIINDFKEFELAGGSDEQVRIVALLDRNPGFTEVDENWVSTRLYEIGPDESGPGDPNTELTLDSELLADLGDVDTGDGELFAQFLTWGIRTYPASNYVVALASHGAGWQGIITDDTAGREQDLGDYTIMSVPELQKAFELALAEAESDKFALLINDACLMSSVEYFSGIASYFDYSIASPEIVVNPALDMTLFTNLLRNQSADPDLVSISEQLINKYIDIDVQSRASADSVYMTNAVTDLAEFDRVVNAIENFAAIVNENPSVRSLDLASARNNVYTYTQFMGDSTMVDLGNLMQRVIALTDDENLIVAAQDVINELDAVRLYGSAGSRVADITSYYNVYFPEESSRFRVSYFDESPLKEWGRMLRNYYSSLTPRPWIATRDTIPFHPPLAPDIRITRVYPSEAPTSIINPAVLDFEVIGRNISYGDATIDQVQPDGSTIRLSSQRLLRDIPREGRIDRENYWLTGLNPAAANWDSTLTLVSDGSNSAFELVTTGETVAFLEGRFREPDGEEWYDVGIAFDSVSPPQVATVQRIVNRSTRTGAVAVIDIPVGSEFVAYRAIVSPDGRVERVEGNSYIWPEGGLTWSWQPAPSGEYRLGLLVTAFGGTIGHADTTVLVDNDGLDSELRGDTRLDLGFTVSRPVQWERQTLVAQFPPSYITQTTDQRSNRSVYFAVNTPGSASNAPLNELPDILARVVELYGLESVSEAREITVDGQPALEVTYTRQTDQGQMLGKGFAVFIRNGLFVTAENLEDEAALIENYEVLLDTTQFFDPAQVANSAAWTNSRSIESTEIALYLPLAAAASYRVLDGWEYITPPPAADGTVFTDSFLALQAFPFESQLQGNEATLTNLVTGFVSRDKERLIITGTNTFFKNFTSISPLDTFFEHYRWDTTLYQAERDGRTYIGRVYVTSFNNQAYAVWVETPDDENAEGIFRDFFEPFLDSILINPQPF